MKPFMEEKMSQLTAGSSYYKAFKKNKDYWDNISQVLEDMGSGKLDPMQADQQIRLMTGGKSLIDINADLRDFEEALIKLQK